MSTNRPPVRVLGIDHVVLRCTRLQDTLRFYRDVLGCPLERVVESIPLYQLRAGTSLIDLIPAGELSDARAPPPESEGNMHHLCLRIARASWGAIEAHLAACKVNFEQPSTRYGAQGFGLSVYIQDPEGNTLELKGPGGSRQRPCIGKSTSTLTDV